MKSMRLLHRLLISVVIVPCVLGCYDSIISFGDSITDTGNLLLSDPPGIPIPFFLPPYGETYFHYPTGRCSNGRLIIDFIAESLGFPLVKPYVEIKDNRSVQNFKNGVNFAVVGATALDAAFLEAMGDPHIFTNSSLSTQLDSFKEMLTSLCNTFSECSKLLSSSLILVGEIGGNDYNNPLMLERKGLEKVQAYVPLVIEEIASTINELIELGASTLLVPGNFPIGCIPAYLTDYETSDKNQYNTSTGCLNWANKFVEFHNEQLQIALSRIRSLHPSVNVIYADYYNAMMQLYESPEQFGFLKGSTLRACCGHGGPYNFDTASVCGMKGSSVCENPAQFISWDGLHYTEAAYRWIAKGLLEGKYTIPPFSTLCVSKE